jgi:hypothetical protein
MRLSHSPLLHREEALAQSWRQSQFAGYIIPCESSYTTNSAGISCLYRLCDELNRRGYASFMTGGEQTAPGLIAPIIEPQSAQMLCERGYAAVYCETIAGNPLNARSVVRWVLNRPGLLGGDEIYADSEQVFSYSDVFTPYIKNRVAGKLYMPTIDEAIFYCDDEDPLKRSLECFYVGKSRWKDGFFDRERAFEITRVTPAKKELGNLFRASRVLYCFDNSTILIYEALLCGCPVVIIPDGTQTQHDFRRLELGSIGIAWGPKEFAGAPVDVGELRKKYELAKQQFSQQLDQMIEASRPGIAFEPDIIEKILPTPPKPTWLQIAFSAGQKSVRRGVRYGRAVETSVRHLRKSLVNRLRGRSAASKFPTLDESLFYCTDRDLAKRKLECYFIGRSRWRKIIFDPARAIEIRPESFGSEVGKLFRASRKFYSFDADTPLIQNAVKCGCPVVIVDKRGRLEHRHPQAA